MTAVVAVLQTPAVVCPAWCHVTQGTHVEQLHDLEGLVIHWSNYVDTDLEDVHIQIGRTTFVDGTPAKDGTNLYVTDGFQEGVSLENAAAFIELLDRVLQEARA